MPNLYWLPLAQRHAWESTFKRACLLQQAPQMKQNNKQLKYFNISSQKEVQSSLGYIWRYRWSQGRRIKQIRTRQGADRDSVTQKGKQVNGAPMEQAGRNQCGVRVNIQQCILQPFDWTIQVFPQGIIDATNICLVRFGVYYHNSLIFTHIITVENAHGLRIAYMHPGPHVNVCCWGSGSSKWE